MGKPIIRLYTLFVYPKDRLVQPLTARVTIPYPAFFTIDSKGGGMGWVGVSQGWSISLSEVGGKVPHGRQWVGVSLGWSNSPSPGIPREWAG